MGKKKAPKIKKTALEIRNERDTILLKWKCLQQTVELEDKVI